VAELLEAVRAAAAPCGLNLIAAIPVARYDAQAALAMRVQTIDPVASSIIVMANGGGAFWQAFSAHRVAHPGWAARDNPLDDFTRFTVEDRIMPTLRAAAVHATAVYPFISNGPTLNFMELGTLAGIAGPSLLGVVVNPIFGPWIAFRAAILIDREIDAPGYALGFDPCPTCTARSCIAACPASAVSASAGWDIPACLTYRVEREAECAPRCHARVACVLGPDHRYPDDELAYHQGRALRVMRPYYERIFDRAALSATGMRHGSRSKSGSGQRRRV
jgi:epoxyqueuosine reductase